MEGQEIGLDVAEALQAELTALLAERDLETVEVVVDEVSQETVDERRRELEALLRETRDPKLKQLPLRAPRGDAAADCWAARFAAKNVTNATMTLAFPFSRIDHLERKASEALSDFNREHADLEAVREKARAVAAWRAGKQDAAARVEDHVAVAEHLAAKLLRKITSLRNDRPAIDAWLGPTEQFVASTFQHLRATDDNVMPAGGPTADEDATIIAQLIVHRGLCGGRRAGWCGVGRRTLVFWERVRDGLVAAHPRWRGPSGEMVSVGWLQEYARRGGRDSLVERALMLPDVAAREEREQPWARPPANIRPYIAPASKARLFLVRRVLAKEDYRAYIGYLAAQESVKELAVHAEPRPNDILAYFLVGVTKEMRLKGFSELAATTRAACTMLSRQTSVGGISVMVWKQLTTQDKYVIYKRHTRTRRKRPRPEPAPARRSADGP